MSAIATITPASGFEPHDTECSNPGRDDYWTCPGCYHDLGNVGAGTHWCPECGRCVICTVEHHPACHARLATQQDEE